MKKRVYQAPLTRIVKVDDECQLMAGSGEPVASDVNVNYESEDWDAPVSSSREENNALWTE